MRCGEPQLPGWTSTRSTRSVRALSILVLMSGVPPTTTTSGFDTQAEGMDAVGWRTSTSTTVLACTAWTLENSDDESTTPKNTNITIEVPGRFLAWIDSERSDLTGHHYQEVWRTYCGRDLRGRGQRSHAYVSQVVSQSRVIRFHSLDPYQSN
ncbi:hypothetical protein PV11_08419 [Exophiala sideris]|uniref:Uncharacterized protein n=1 Tax=Exophiala sideris TaxID=1016849 RepID=A0A0D1YDC3_9EURO|nr:hypothetical protein PV11_08419 [Exophiala sideris]